MKTLKFLMLLALLVSIYGVETALAQVERVEMRVDGLACPFCAYGLEKKLKEVKGVGKVTIYVDKGVAILSSKKDLSIDIERLEPVAKDAGFTPGSISLTVAGAIKEKNGAPVFLVSGTDLQFMLKSNAQLEKLRAESIPQGGTVKVTGSLTKETPQGHHGHPYTLTIEKVEATK
ncbi:heavy-metal-associated domain-containing protein [candidate division KSB1 bacterium]|nr:heavy-metal-associated domain-containing protein [candidate division KSB1 bacterium]